MKEVTHLQIKKKKGYLSRLSVQGRELSKEKKKSQIRIKHTT